MSEVPQHRGFTSVRMKQWQLLKLVLNCQVFHLSTTLILAFRGTLPHSIQGYLAHKTPPPVGPYISPVPKDLW